MRSDTFSLFLAVLEAWWAQWERKWKDGTNKERSGPGRVRAKRKPEGERENAGEHWVLPAGFPCECGLNDNGAHQGPSTTQSHGSARNTGTHSLLLHIHTHAAQIYKHWFSCLPYCILTGYDAYVKRTKSSEINYKMFCWRLAMNSHLCAVCAAMVFSPSLDLSLPLSPLCCVL